MASILREKEALEYFENFENHEVNDVNEVKLFWENWTPWISSISFFFLEYKSCLLQLNDNGVVKI